MPSETESHVIREIVVTRLIDAPREKVFKAWTLPKYLSKWWGPNGFTSAIQRMDVLPGGRWDYILQGPDGSSYTNQAVYVEVLKPERIIYDHGPAPEFRVTVNFQDLIDKTDLALRMFFGTAKARDEAVRQFGGEEGLNQAFDRLATLLARMRSAWPPRRRKGGNHG